MSPRTVGGCRPVRIQAFVDPRLREVEHRRTVTAYGVASEVLRSARVTFR